MSRLARISRLLRGKKRAELVRDVVLHRGQYAVFITALAAMIVLTITCLMVLRVREPIPRRETLFAAWVLMLVGIWDAVAGLVAIVNDEFYVVTPEYIFQFDAPRGVGSS